MTDRFQKALDAILRANGSSEHPVVTLFREVTSILEDTLPSHEAKKPAKSGQPPDPRPDPLQERVKNMTAERDAIRERLENMTAERDAWRKAYLAQETVVNAIRATIITAPSIVKPDSAC